MTASTTNAHAPRAGAAMPRRLRVLFLNDTARNGGPGRSLHSILRFLDSSVIERTVVLPRPGPIADLLARDGAADDLRFEPDLVENPIEPWGRAMERRDFDAALPLKAARAAGNAVKVARGLLRLALFVRRGGFRLVYCNGTNADFAGAALARLTGVPALWHVRYTSLPRAVTGLHRRLSASPGVCRIVCVSKAAAALFPHCAPKVRVVHNAIDAEHFHPGKVVPSLRAELRLPAEAVVVGSHGRVLRRKGYVELVHAARLVLERAGVAERKHVVFVVVGDTPEDFRVDHASECRRLAAALGIASRVHFLGFREDVRPLVADFDVAVVPSVYADPLPRSVIESMALGKPVVAYDVGGVAEMLDAEMGQVVPFEAASGGAAASPAAVQRLAAAISRYVHDPELRARHGLAARARALRHFDARVHARRIEREIFGAAGETPSQGRRPTSARGEEVR
jgi:glycosyltransferase involved in cell wall biosynthesis